VGVGPTFPSLTCFRQNQASFLWLHRQARPLVAQSSDEFRSFEVTFGAWFMYQVLQGSAFPDLRSVTRRGNVEQAAASAQL
jgi:hypothetical protein